jgi:hypothetical protein
MSYIVRSGQGDSSTIAAVFRRFRLPALGCQPSIPLLMPAFLPALVSEGVWET